MLSLEISIPHSKYAPVRTKVLKVTKGVVMAFGQQGLKKDVVKLNSRSRFLQSIHRYIFPLKLTQCSIALSQCIHSIFKEQGIDFLAQF